MEKDLEQYFTDAVMARPHGLTVGGRHFFFYPVTLGMTCVLKRIIVMLEINHDILQQNVDLEALRLAHEKRDLCLSYIVYHTCKGRDDVFDEEEIGKRTELFDKECSESDVAYLMITLLSEDKLALFEEHYGIRKEQEHVSTVMRIKKQGDKNNLTFCGKTIYGTMIDVACERYGWTKDYVVWGIDFVSLRLLLDDRINSIYVSDDEWKRLPAYIKNTQDRDRVNGDNAAELRKAIKSQKWD